MKEKLKSISCDPICGFSVTSHNEKELLGIAKKHTKAVHKMDMPNTEIKKLMKTVK